MINGLRHTLHIGGEDGTRGTMDGCKCVLERSPAGFPRKKFPPTSKTAPAADGRGQGAACGVVESAPDFIDHDVYFVTIVLRVGGGRILDVTRLLARDGLQLQPFHDPCSQRQLKYFPHNGGKIREQRRDERKKGKRQRKDNTVMPMINQMKLSCQKLPCISSAWDELFDRYSKKVATSKAKKRCAQKSGQEKKERKKKFPARNRQEVGTK